MLSKIWLILLTIVNVFLIVFNNYENEPIVKSIRIWLELVPVLIKLINQI